MAGNRYLQFVLTVIAVELLWLAVNGLPARASAAADAMPVVITGVQLDTGEHILPVAVVGTVAIEARAPLKIEADQPLKVETVPYTPSARPGE